MFNSAGNKGRLQTSGKVEPFEVLGKWLARCVMWQLGFANNLFVGKGGLLGPSEINWDSASRSFIANDELVDDDDANDDDFDGASVATDSDCDLDELTPEDLSICDIVSCADDGRYAMRKRRYTGKDVQYLNVVMCLSIDVLFLPYILHKYLRRTGEIITVYSS